MVRIKDIRLQKYDYKSDGYYFVTVVCNQRNNYFEKTEIISDLLTDTVNKIQGACLDYYVIMPNHVHFILILQNSNIGLGEIVRRFKAKVSHSYGLNVWQPNYYEHIIRSENALNKIREYIQNNPQDLLLEFDRFY